MLLLVCGWCAALHASQARTSVHVVFGNHLVSLCWVGGHTHMLTHLPVSLSHHDCFSQLPLQDIGEEELRDRHDVTCM